LKILRIFSERTADTAGNLVCFLITLKYNRVDVYLLPPFTKKTQKTPGMKSAAKFLHRKKWQKAICVLRLSVSLLRPGKRGITQRELEEMSGVRQPIIARMENGKTTPNLSTVLKVLAPLGKTLYIGDLPKKKITKPLF